MASREAENCAAGCKGEKEALSEQATGLERASSRHDSALHRWSTLEAQLQEAKLQLEVITTERSELAAKVSELDARLRTAARLEVAAVASREAEYFPAEYEGEKEALSERLEQAAGLERASSRRDSALQRSNALEDQLQEAKL